MGGVPSVPDASLPMVLVRGLSLRWRKKDTGGCVVPAAHKSSSSRPLFQVPVHYCAPATFPYMLHAGIACAEEILWQSLLVLAQNLTERHFTLKAQTPRQQRCYLTVMTAPWALGGNMHQVFTISRIHLAAREIDT